MTAQKLRNKLLGLAFIGLFVSPVYAQTLSVETASVPVGDTDAAVTWSWQADGTVVSFFSTITYDATLLTPRTTEVLPGLFVVDGCIGPGTTASQIGCTLNSPGVIGLAAQNTGLPPPPLPNYLPGGTITFDINTAAVEGDFSDLAVTITATTPGVVGDINTVDGRVTLVGAPPAVPVIEPVDWTVTVGVGATNPSEIFTIRNNAAAGQTPPAQALDITTIGISGAGAAAFSTAGTCVAGTSSLAAQESCTVIVTLDASTVGTFAGSLDVGTSAGGLNATLNGTVNPSDANLTIAPAAHNFGSLDINAPAGSQAFTVTNTATNDAVTGISVPALAAPFAITANTCGASLAPGVNCSITVSFNPTAAGNFTDTLAVNSAANNVSAALEGVGTATPNLSVNPPFGPVNLGSASAGETITVSQFAGAPTGVTNAGSADGTVACTLQNESTAGVFSTNPALTNVPVPAGETVPFSVSCTLPADGEDGDAYTATLACSVDGAPAVDATSHFLSCSVSEFEPIPVPTMSAWSLALFALLMLLVGGISIRFFRV